MSSNLIKQPYEMILDPTGGGGRAKPVANGKFYVGEIDKDPIANPRTDIAYKDESGQERPLTSPLTLNNSGAFVVSKNDGTIIQPYMKDAVGFSVLIQDARGRDVYSDLNTGDPGNIAEAISEYSDIVYKASGGKSSVENMIDSFNLNPLMYAVGTYIKTGGTTFEYLDSTGTVTKDNFRAFDVLNAIDFEKGGSTDFSEAIQAAVDHLGGASGEVVVTDRVECKSIINVASGASVSVTGMIVVDTDFSGDVLFDCATVRHNTKLDIKVTSAAMESVDKIGYVGSLVTTPNIRVVRGGDCRQLKVTGDITGILTRPIETSTGFEYDIHDMNIWGPNLNDADTINTDEDNNLESNRYTCGIFSPSTKDSKMSNVVIVGYNIGACIGSTWVITDFHPWALKSSMIYGLAVFGQHNRGHGIYPDKISKADGRAGVGIYEVTQADRGTTVTTVNNNYYGAVQVIGTYGANYGDVWAVQLGDDGDQYAGTRSKVEFANAAFTTDFPISYPNENIKMINLIGQAQKVNWRTPRYTGIEQPNNFVNEGAIPTQATLPNLLVWAVKHLTGCYGNAKIVSNQNGWINGILIGLNSTAFDSTHNHTLSITTSKNEITNQVYVQLEISSVRKTDIVAKYQYYIQMATWTILYQDNEFYQGVVLGNTVSRPSLYFNGFQYYDTDLNKPIWIIGGTWRDAAGNIA
ncbi:tailspike protein [Vibrio phage 1.091.O._10N.286.52.B12]|nr:tailspike protein [Vibrio phage 1.091.O._10N.286.52.B12]